MLIQNEFVHVMILQLILNNELEHVTSYLSLIGNYLYSLSRNKKQLNEKNKACRTQVDEERNEGTDSQTTIQPVMTFV